MDKPLDALEQSLLNRSPRPPLLPHEIYDPSLTEAIDGLVSSLTVKAGLHLLNDDLGRSHQFVQSAESDPAADYWHAIIHRREGDWSNAKYWFRRVGTHPVLRAVYGDDPQAPYAFVDLCRSHDSDQESALEEAQLREMTLLLIQSRA